MPTGSFACHGYHQGSAAGDHIFLAFSSAPGGPVAFWNAASPNQFMVSSANASASDLAVAADGNMFALQVNSSTEIRGSDLALSAVPVSPELVYLPGRTAVPGLVVHPAGALIYQPFLTAPNVGHALRGGIDILDAHSGLLRLRVFLPQQFLTAVDGLRGSFLATDENGQRLFALTSSDGSPQNAALTIVQLASVPLGIGTISPAAGPSSGGTLLTIRGSGFQSGIEVTIGGKSANPNMKDMNTLTVTSPSLSLGTQQIVLTNPDGESISLDAAFIAN